MDPNKHHHCQLIFFLLLLSLLPSTLASCSRKCGSITVPFPFGTSPGCHLSHPSNFLLHCNLSSSPPSLTLPTDPPLELYHIDLPNALLYVKLPVSFLCLQPNSASSSKLLSYDFSNLPYAISPVSNSFYVVGCDNLGIIAVQGRHSGCFVSCRRAIPRDMRSCSGLGCCEARLYTRLRSLSIQISSPSNYSQFSGLSRCGAAFVGPAQSGEFLEWDFEDEASLEGMRMTVALELELGEGCGGVKGRETACVSENSVCESFSGAGFACRCSNGVRGNPYLPGGCQKDLSGLYVRTSLFGMNDINRLWLVVGASVLVFLLIVGSSCFCFLNQRRKIARQRKRVADLKAKMFKQNGGLVLQELIASTPGSSFKLFSQAELNKATEGFKETHIIGRGGHGVVFKGELDSGLTVAIKKSKAMNERESKEFAREMAILSQINHVNIVKILGCCLEVEIPMLVYEFVPGGTLFSLIHGQSLIELSTRLRFAREIADALAYLHSYASPPIFHKDVKTSNVLLDGSLKAKISDFGASVVVAADEVEVATVVQGTCGYLDPEYLQTYQFTEKSDVYSFGVVLVELLTKRKPFHVQNDDDFKGLASIFVERYMNGRLSEIVDPQLLGEVEMGKVTEVAKLACRCLSLRGADRPTMKQISMALHKIEGYGDDSSMDGKKSLKNGGISTLSVDLEGSSSGYTGSTVYSSPSGR